MVRIEDLFDLEKTMARSYLEGFEYPWQALKGIGAMILELGQSLGSDYEKREESVWVHRTAKVFDSAYLGPVCIVGPKTEVRHGAFVRGNALIGENCVIGNSVELKNVIIFDCCQVPHFNYVGDSILGFHAHMGAGAITSNVRADRGNVVVHAVGENGKELETGLRKVGAMLGDFAEVGCNAVLNPGTVVGRNTQIYPLACVRGVVPEGCIYKTGGVIVKKNR